MGLERVRKVGLDWVMMGLEWIGEFIEEGLEWSWIGIGSLGEMELVYKYIISNVVISTNHQKVIHT